MRSGSKSTQTKKKDNPNRLTVKEIKHELSLLKTKIPPKGSGSGAGGRVMKRDLVKVLIAARKKRVGIKNILFAVPVEIAKKMAYKMDPVDVINLCRTSKHFLKVCTEPFWKEYVKRNKNKYLSADKGELRTWRQFVVERRSYGDNDLWDIGEKIRLGLMTEEKGRELVEEKENNLKYEGKYVNVLGDREKERIEYNKTTYGEYGSYGDPYDDDSGEESEEEEEETVVFGWYDYEDNFLSFGESGDEPAGVTYWVVYESE